MGFAYCHPAGAQNFEVVPTFLYNFCTLLCYICSIVDVTYFLAAGA